MPKSIEGNTESIEDKIRSWLETQGSRFELIVARAFQRAGFSVAVSEFRRDPDTGIPREIDVIATHTSLLTPGRLFDLNFVIECKHSRNYPWIVFQTPNGIKPTETDKFLCRFATNIGHVALLEMSTGNQAQASGLFSLPQRMAHGVRCAFEEKKAAEKKADRAYEAVTQVCSGAAALIADKQTSLSPCAIAFPVVIIQGRLFECTIRDTTELDLAEVTRATLFWSRPTAQSSQVPVELLTDATVEDYATQRFQQCEALRPTIENGLPKTSGLDVVSE
jgi:hypothetical protein